MANYEIMLIVDPKEDFKNVELLVNEVLNKPQIKKLERTELAYEINKSKTAHYFLINVSANGSEIKELTRKVNISKTIWRILTINIDNEVGREEGIAKIEAHKEKLAKQFEERRWMREERNKERKIQEENSKKDHVKESE